MHLWLEITSHARIYFVSKFCKEKKMLKEKKNCYNKKIRSEIMSHEKFTARRVEIKKTKKQFCFTRDTKKIQSFLFLFSYYFIFYFFYFVL